MTTEQIEAAARENFSPPSATETAWAEKLLLSEWRAPEELQHRINVAKAHDVLARAWMARHFARAAPDELPMVAGREQCGESIASTHVDTGGGE